MNSRVKPSESKTGLLRYKTIIRRPSLQSKFLSAFIAVALLPLSLLFFLNECTLRTVLVNHADHALLSAATQTAFSLDAFVNNNLSNINAESQLPALIDFLSLPEGRSSGQSKEKEKAASALFALNRKDQTNIVSYALLDRHGRTLIDTYTPGVGEDHSQHVLLLRGRLFHRFEATIRVERKVMNICGVGYRGHKASLSCKPPLAE